MSQMRIDVLTLFPPMFAGPFDWSIVKRAREKGVVEIHIHNLRDWAKDKHKTVDDRPYGGGPGMIMKVDVVDRAVSSLKTSESVVILLDATGKIYDQNMATSLIKFKHLVIICGHYEGVDYRVREHIADEVISVGNFVLSGGEIPAMIIVDSIVRLLPGALGNEDSLTEESHGAIRHEYPQYTRPKEYKGWKVPEALLSGNHKLIDKWRKG